MYHVHGAARGDRKQNVVTGIVSAGYAILFHIQFYYSALMMVGIKRWSCGVSGSVQSAA